MNFRSIHAKVVALQVVLVASVLLAFSILVYQRVGDSLRHALDMAIRCQANYACYVLCTDGNRHPTELGREIAAHPDLPPESRIIRILNPAGKELYASSLNKAHVLSLTPTTYAHVIGGRLVFEGIRAGRSELRVATVPAVIDGHLTAIVQVATTTDHLRDALARLRLMLILVSLGALLLAAIGGRLLSRVALRPVAEMTEMVRCISIDNLMARVPVSPTRDEVEHLGDTFNAMLARIHAAVSQLHRFTDDASHELRTPLTTIKGEIEVALRRSRSREEMQEVLRSVLDEARHLSKIVGDMLVLARADSGETRLELSPAALRVMASQAIQRCSPLASTGGCEISLAPGPEVIASVDEHYLLQLIENLVDNAVQHTPHGGHVTVVIGSDGNWATLAVSDDGRGILPENLPRIFDRFFTTRNGERKGTGLGLSICQWIAQAHGGHIHVQSQVGKGSTFTVRLPRIAS